MWAKLGSRRCVRCSEGEFKYGFEMLAGLATTMAPSAVTGSMRMVAFIVLVEVSLLGMSVIRDGERV